MLFYITMKSNNFCSLFVICRQSPLLVWLLCWCQNEAVPNIFSFIFRLLCSPVSALVLHFYFPLRLYFTSIMPTSLLHHLFQTETRLKSWNDLLPQWEQLKALLIMVYLSTIHNNLSNHYDRQRTLKQSTACDGRKQNNMTSMLTDVMVYCCRQI